MAVFRPVNISDPIVMYGNEALAKNGVFSFPSMTIIRRPGSQTEIELVISDLQTYNNSIPFVAEPTKFTVSFR